MTHSLNWRPVTETPAPGTKIIALYSDGSGAVLLWRHDYGFLGHEGDDYYDEWFDGNIGLWAPVPPDFSFWCENRADDPVSLSLPKEPTP